MSPPSKLFPAPGHDHKSCVADALCHAEAICQEHKARLTPIRRRVLEIIWESHAPLGAYDILERMNAEGGRNAPPTVYRALDFLLAHGFIHRIESLNAFLGCGMPGGFHPAQFFICSDCGNVAEVRNEKIGEAIQDSARLAGFEVGTPVVEISGRCPECRDA